MLSHLVLFVLRERNGGTFLPKQKIPMEKQNKYKTENV